MGDTQLFGETSVSPADQQKWWSGWFGLFIVGADAVLFAQALPAGVARAVVALPALLLLPGFCLLSVLLRRSPLRDGALIFVFSVTLSLAIMMIDALLINALRIRLSSASLGFTLMLATGILASVATAKRIPIFPWRERVPPEDAPRRPASGAQRSTMPKSIAVLVSIVTTLIVVSFIATHLPAPASKPFSSLSLGSTWAQRGNAPTVTTGERLSIPVVAVATSTASITYGLQTSIDGHIASTTSLLLSKSRPFHGDVSVVTPLGVGLHRVTVALVSPSSSTVSTANQLVVYLDNVSS